MSWRATDMAPAPTMDRRGAVRALLAMATAAVSAQPQAVTPLRVCVVPQYAAGAIHATWMPLLKLLSARSGVVMELSSASSIPHFEQMLLAGVPDLAFMNPYHAVMVQATTSYVPLVADASLPLSGILVVRRESNLTTLRDLEAKTIAFPSPNSFGASLYMRALLAEREHLHFEARYVSTHSNVFRQVASGEAAAGGAVLQTLAKEPPQLRAQLRVLYETPGTMPHPLCAHPRVAPALRARVQAAILALAADAEGAPLLRAAQLSAPRAVSYADYAPLEKLGLSRFVVASQ